MVGRLMCGLDLYFRLGFIWVPFSYYNIVVMLIISVSHVFAVTAILNVDLQGNAAFARRFIVGTLAAVHTLGLNIFVVPAPQVAPPHMLYTYFASTPVRRIFFVARALRRVAMVVTEITFNNAR